MVIKIYFSCDCIYKEKLDTALRDHAKLQMGMLMRFFTRHSI